jgi:hypothetical protein
MRFVVERYAPRYVLAVLRNAVIWVVWINVLNLLVYFGTASWARTTDPPDPHLEVSLRTWVSHFDLSALGAIPNPINFETASL